MRRDKKERPEKPYLHDLPLFNKPAFETLSAYLDDTELLRDLIETFLQRADALLEQLDTTLNRGDAEAYRRLLHELLNEAQVVRADALQHLCKIAEDQAAQVFPSQAGERLVEVRRCVEDTQKVLKHWLRNTGLSS